MIIVMSMKSKIEKVSLGIKELDELVSGGIPQPSTLLILGDIGTGKSVICQQFAYAQAKAKKKCVYFCIDSPPSEIRANMMTLDWDPYELEKKGYLKFVDLFAGKEEYSDEIYQGNVRNYDELVSTLRRFFRENERFVVDSISSLAFIHGEKKAYDLVQRIHGWTLESNAVTIINAVKGMHSEFFEKAIQQALSNVITLEREGDEVFISVVKTTKTSHKRGRFGLEIDEDGIRVIV